MKKHAYSLEWKNCKMYGYLSWYYFATIIINIIIINILK